jgi:hypothetical protein
VDLFLSDDDGEPLIYKAAAAGGSLGVLRIPVADPGLTALAADAHGNVYWGRSKSSALAWEPFGGGHSSSCCGYITPISGVAVDNAGDIYWDSESMSGVSENPAGKNQVNSVVGANCGPDDCYEKNPDGVALNRNLDVFVADSGKNRVVEIPGDRSRQKNIGTGLQKPFGVAVDAAGDVFISDDAGVYEVHPNGQQIRVGSGLSHPGGIASDAAGDLFIADTGNKRIVEVRAGGGPQVTIVSGLNDAYLVSVEAWY